MTNIGKFYVYRDEDGNAVAVAKRAKGPNGGVVGIDFCKLGVPFGSTTREDINNRAEFIAAALNTFLNTSVALAAKDAEIEQLKAALTNSTIERVRGLLDWLDEHEENASLLIASLTGKQIETARAALAGGSPDAP